MTAKDADGGAVQHPPSSIDSDRLYKIAALYGWGAVDRAIEQARKQRYCEQ